jgi:hypothetical protein
MPLLRVSKHSVFGGHFGVALKVVDHLGEQCVDSAEVDLL